MYTPDAARRLAAAHEALDLATEHGDPVLLAQVAPAVLYALMGAGHRELRARVAGRAIRAAESTGDPRLDFSAHLSAYNMAVESPDQVVAARSLARMRAIAQAVAEPRLRWTVGLYDTFDATMAGRLDDAESIATANLDLGLQIGVPDAFAFFAGQLFVIASDGGRAEELLPVVEQATNDNPAILPFKLAYGIICAGVGRDDVARDILREGLATRFSEIPVDNVWMTSVIGYAVLAIELGDAEAAAYLRPIIEPFAAEVAFNGVTSQGPVATYRRASLRRSSATTRSRRSTCSPRSTPPPRSDGSTTGPRRCSRSRRTGTAGTARSTANPKRGSAKRRTCAGRAASGVGYRRSTRSPGSALDKTCTVSGRTPS